MNPLIRFTFLLLGGTSLASAATTQLLNVDFGPGTVKSGGAVLGTTGDIWNGISGSGVTTIPLTTLNWADNTGSSGISLSQTSGIYSGSFNLGSTTDELMKDYLSLYALGNNGPINFRLSGFTPNSTLDSIVFYANGDAAGQNAAFTVGGVTETTTAPAANAGTPTSSTTEGGVYVRFDNVLVNGSGQVDFTWTNPAGGNNFAAFNGMQIAVPEPSAALLGGLGMLALLRRRR